jgi:citrate synthase
MSGYKVTGPVVVLPTIDGTERYLYRGAPVSDEFTQEGIERGVELGLISEVPSLAELAEAAAEEQAALAAAREAEYEKRVQEAAAKLVADRDKVAADKVAAEKAAEAAKSQAAKQPSK